MKKTIHLKVKKHFTFLSNLHGLPGTVLFLALSSLPPTDSGLLIILIDPLKSTYDTFVVAVSPIDKANNVKQIHSMESAIFRLKSSLEGVN